MVCLIKSRVPLCQMIHAALSRRATNVPSDNVIITAKLRQRCCVAATRQEIPDEIPPHKMFEYSHLLEYTRGN